MYPKIANEYLLNTGIGLISVLPDRVSGTGFIELDTAPIEVSGLQNARRETRVFLPGAAPVQDKSLTDGIVGFDILTNIQLPEEFWKKRKKKPEKESEGKESEPEFIRLHIVFDVEINTDDTHPIVAQGAVLCVPACKSTVQKRAVSAEIRSAGPSYTVWIYPKPSSPVLHDRALYNPQEGHCVHSGERGR